MPEYENAPDPCFVFAVLLTPEAGDVLIAGLVSRDYTVGPVSDEDAVKTPGPVCCLTALRVDMAVRDEDPHMMLLEEVKEILTGYGWFFIIVEHQTASCWEQCNITLPAADVAPMPAMQRLTRD